jgi:hypothetical protein
MVAARIQGPFVIAGRSHDRARIAASSQGGLAMLAIVHSPIGADSTKSSGGPLPILLDIRPRVSDERR